jgi:hypothetical protein
MKILFNNQLNKLFVNSFFGLSSHFILFSVFIDNQRIEITLFNIVIEIIYL